MSKLDEAIERFIHSEGKFQEPSLSSYIQSLKEILDKMEAKTMREARRLEMARENLGGIRRHTKRLQEKIDLLEGQKKTLEERVKVLEEHNTQQTLEETNGQF